MSAAIEGAETGMKNSGAAAAKRAIPRGWRRLGAIAIAAATLAGGLLGARASRGEPENVDLPGLAGGHLTSQDLQKGNVVLVFWASWSPRCRDIAERLNAIAASWGGKARIAAIDFQESPEDVQKFLTGKKLTVPVFLDRDGGFSKQHDMTTLPGLLVLKGGAEAYRGRLPADVDAVLREHLGG